MTLYAITVAATLLTGYAAGRYRPWERIRNWAWRVMHHPQRTIAWKTRAVIALLILADKYLQVRLHPPKPRPRRPAPKLRTDTEGAP